MGHEEWFSWRGGVSLKPESVRADVPENIELDFMCATEWDKAPTGRTKTRETAGV